MADDDKLPLTTLRGDQLWVEGDKEPFVRKPERTIYLNVSQLAVHHGFPCGTEGGETARSEVIQGTATLENLDTFAVVGIDFDPKVPIKFHLRPIAPENEEKFETDRRVMIGYFAHDWEYEQTEQFWVQVYLSQPMYDDVLAVVRHGHVASLRVGLDSTMWVRDFTDHMGTGKRRWYLAPTAGKRSRSPSLERAKLSLFSMDERFGIHPPPVDEDADEKGVPAVVLPAQLYQLLQVLILIGVVTAGLMWWRR